MLFATVPFGNEMKEDLWQQAADAVKLIDLKKCKTYINSTWVEPPITNSSSLPTGSETKEIIFYRHTVRVSAQVKFRCGHPKVATWAVIALLLSHFVDLFEMSNDELIDEGSGYNRKIRMQPGSEIYKIVFVSQFFLARNIGFDV